MKVLLDENLDHALRSLLGSHQVVTVAYMGWAGLKNGELLQTAEDNGIDVLLTGDRTLTYENNLTGRRIAIVALSAIQLPIIRLHVQTIITALDTAELGSFQTVDCGSFTRKSKPPHLSQADADRKTQKPKHPSHRPRLRSKLPERQRTLRRRNPRSPPRALNQHNGVYGD